MKSGAEILCIGRTREQWLQQGEAEYLKRLQKILQVEITELKTPSRYGKDSPDTIRNREAELLLGKIRDDRLLVALDERGDSLSSGEFAAMIGEHWIGRGSPITFMIGGPFGFADSVRIRADLVIRLSSMTFTHQMVRVILLEQLYRAFQILRGGEYAAK